VSPHHGTLNALLLPGVLRFNAPTLGAVLPVLAEATGLPPGADAAALADAIAALNQRLGLPPGLAAMGVTEADLAPAAAAALRDHHHLTNPRTAREDDYRAILHSAFHGTAS